jgi:hypothetical protein
MSAWTRGEGGEGMARVARDVEIAGFVNRSLNLPRVARALTRACTRRAYVAGAYMRRQARPRYAHIARARLSLTTLSTLGKERNGNRKNVARAESWTLATLANGVRL